MNIVIYHISYTNEQSFINTCFNHSFSQLRLLTSNFVKMRISSTANSGERGKNKSDKSNSCTQSDTKNQKVELISISTADFMNVELNSFISFLRECGWLDTQTSTVIGSSESQNVSIWSMINSLFCQLISPEKRDLWGFSRFIPRQIFKKIIIPGWKSVENVWKNIVKK